MTPLMGQLGTESALSRLCPARPRCPSRVGSLGGKASKQGKLSILSRCVGLVGQVSSFVLVGSGGSWRHRTQDRSDCCAAAHGHAADAVLGAQDTP